MAGPFDIDPTLPPPIDLTPDPVQPWSWVPSEWASLAAPAPEPIPLPEEPPPLQPGLGLPTQALDAAPLPAPEPIAPGLGVPQMAQGLADAVPPEPAPVLPPLPEAAPTFDAIDPRTWGQSLGEQDLEHLARTNPAEFAQYSAAHDETLKAEQRRREAEMAQRNAEEAEANHRDLLDVQQRAADEADALAKESVDPNGYVRNLSPLGFVATFVSVVVGGLHAATKAGAGRNVGLEMLNRAIDRDFEAQKINLGNKRNAVAELRARGLSEFQAREAHRLSAYATARDQLLTEMQNYDPAGTTARRLVGEKLRVESAMAQSAEAMRRQRLDEELKLAKDRRESAKTLADLRAADDKHLIDQRKAMGIGAAKPKDLITPEQALAEYGVTIDKPRTLGEVAKIIDAKKKSVDLARAQGQETPEQERARQFGINGPDGKPLLDESGQPVKGRDVAEATKLTEQIADTDEVIRLMDNVLRLRKQHGWSSDLIKSDEWRQMKGDWAQAILKKKNIDELGVIAGPDMELMGAALGAEDPTTLRDPTAGIARARQNAVQGLHGRLRIKGVGEQSMPQYPETWKLEKPKPTALDASIDDAIKFNPIDTAKFAAGRPLSPMEQDMLAKEDAGLQRVERAIQDLADTATAGGKGAAKARAGLAEIANGAVSPHVKRLASTALMTLTAAEAAKETD